MSERNIFDDSISVLVFSIRFIETQAVYGSSLFNFVRRTQYITYAINSFQGSREGKPKGTYLQKIRTIPYKFYAKESANIKG